MQLLKWVVKGDISREVIFQQNKRRFQPHNKSERQCLVGKSKVDIVGYHDQRLDSSIEFVVEVFELYRKAKGSKAEEKKIRAIES